MFLKRELHKGFICLMCLGITNGAVTVTPSNTAVVAGNWMAMECRTTNGSKVYRWTFTQPTSTSKEFVLTVQNGRPWPSNKYSYGADMDESGSGFLYLNSTQLDDAGLYTCYSFVNDAAIQQNSAQLTVFENEPSCETNYTTEDNVTLTEDDSIWMECRVNFRGMWAPSVEWKQHTESDKGEEGEERKVFRGVSTVTMLNTSITTTLVHVGGFTKATYFSFRIFFEWHNGTVQVTATNLPNFSYIWKSPRIIPPQKIEEEVYVVPLPVEVEPSTPTTTKIPSGSNDWYIISLILLAAVLIFVSLSVGFGVMRYLRFRRARDITLLYNASASSTVPVLRLERSLSIEYDITPTATPNVYDRIEGADADDDAAAQAMTSQNYDHPLLTQCYSGLVVAMAIPPSYYDTLDQYEKMDLFNSETEPAASKECSRENVEEERYTTPVSKKGATKPNSPGSSDYLAMVGDARKSITRVLPLYADTPNDSDEDNYPDGKLRAFPKSNDDYLQPGPETMDDLPSCQLTQLPDHVYSE